MNWLVLTISLIVLYGLFSVKNFIKLRKVDTNLKNLPELIGKLNEDILIKEDEVENLGFEQDLFYQYHQNCLEYCKTPMKDEILEIIRNRFDLYAGKIRTQFNTLPVIGLIGTFGGVTLAIFNLNLDTNLASAATIEILKNNLNQLPNFLEGIRLAFISSLLALFIAILLRMVSSKIFEKIELKLSNISKVLLIDYLPRFSGTTTDEKMLKGINNLSKSIKKYTDDFQNNISTIIHEFENWAKSNSTALIEIKQGIESSVDKFISNIDKLDEMINQNYETLQKVSSDYQFYLEEVKDFNKSISGIIDSNMHISDNIFQISNRIDSNIDQLSQNIDTKLSKIENLTNSFDTHNEKLNEIIGSIGEIRKEFEENITAFFNELKNKNSESLHEINQLKELFPPLIRKFEGIETIQDNSNLIYKRMQAIIEELNKPLNNLNDSATNIFDASSNLVGNISTKLDSLFRDLKNQENISINNIQIDTDLVNKFDEISSLNKELVDNLKSELNTLQKTINDYSILKFLKLKRNGK